MLHLYYNYGNALQAVLDRWVDWTTVKITEQINIPATMTFSLNNVGEQWPILYPRAYVQLYSTRWQRSVFTGYITSAPEITPIGVSPHAPSRTGKILYRYDITCQSDESLLNVKAVQFIPAFVNQTQGKILASIANTLCPGFFNTDNMMSGDIVPYYEYDPSQSWSEIAKTFADGVRYRYKVRDKQIWYVPYGDGNLGISYDEEVSEATFDPYGMQTTVLQVPIVNDVTIIGDTEAGNNREDYFIGDGFTGNFPLRHKVFNGASTLLLDDDWTESDISTQNWYLNDPAGQFNIGQGALNLISSFQFPEGLSYLQLNNGLELAGGINLEHGEFGWNDASSGIVGGLYTDTSMSASACIAGFYISTPSGATLGASGAGGILMMPTYNNVPVGSGIVSEQNHTYVLQTLVNAPSYTRYQLQYRSLAGPTYGGSLDEQPGSISFIIQDYDIAAATGFYYQPVVNKLTINNVPIPAFAVYGLISNIQMNCTVNYTTIAEMPLGTLQAWEGPSGLFWPSGICLPMLPPGSGGYIGGVIPWPSDASGAIYPPPTLRNTLPTTEVMGQADFELQAAQITQGNESDTLAFYAQTLPTAGIPIRLQSWEAQAAMSRVQASGSIQEEMEIVGDDGLRSAIVSNLNPLPRTSEDCDNAAQAFLEDRTSTFYNGTYTCTSYFLNQYTSDPTFWPTCGRFLYVNAPKRGISQQQMLVTQVQISVLDAVGSAQGTLTQPPSQVGEVLQFVITFGADLHLEKTLLNFVDIQPSNVLTNADKANPPDPRFTYQVDNYYQPDVKATTAYPITDTTVGIVVEDNLGLPLEVRLEDANWGQGITPDYIGTFNTPAPSQGGALVYGGGVYSGGGGTAGPIVSGRFSTNVNVDYGPAPTFTLTRQQYDQTWYMRYVSGGSYSRRSKVVRVVYPQKPAKPITIAADTEEMQFNFDGDVRSIFGFEMRAADNETIIVQKPVYSVGDLDIDLTQTKAVAPFAPVLSTSFYINASGDMQMYSSSPFSGNSSILWGRFLIDDSKNIPDDAVIQAIYPVLTLSWQHDGADPYADFGTDIEPGGFFSNFYTGGSDFGINFGDGFDSTTFGATLSSTPVSIGTDMSLLVEEIIAVGMIQSLFLSGLTDDMNVTAVGFAIYFTSESSPSIDQQMTPPWPVPDGWGVAWALPNEVQVFAGPISRSAATGQAAIYAGQLAASREFFAYFFNHQWSYSNPEVISLPAPDPPILEEGYRFGQSLNIMSDILPRNDIKEQRWQIGYDPSFNNDDEIIIDTTNNFQAGSLTTNVPISADLYVRSQFSDYIGSGNWCDPLHIPVGDLIASDYLAAQGSTLPIIVGGSGGIISYVSDETLIVVTVGSFTVLYPNGSQFVVPEEGESFTETKDTDIALAAGSGYLFYFSMPSAVSATPTVFIDGPYQNPSASALANTIADGRVPLENGALTFYTSTTATGSAGGGGGGSFSSNTLCGVPKSQIMMADGTGRDLEAVLEGDSVADGEGGVETITRKLRITGVDVATVYLASGKQVRCGLAHTFAVNYGWEPLCDLMADFKATGVYPMVDTVDGYERILAVDDFGVEDVILLRLSGPKHTYVLDRIKTHNTLYKNGTN